MTRNLGYIYTAPDEFSIGWKFLLDTLFTQNRLKFSSCSHGTLTGWASKFWFGLSGSVWTEHWSTRILNRSKIRRLMPCEHCCRNISSYNKSRLFVDTAKLVMVITKLTSKTFLSKGKRNLARPVINLPLETQQMWRHNIWSFHHNWQCKVFRSCLDQTTYSWWGENVVHKDKHRHRLSMNPKKSKQKVRI